MTAKRIKKWFTTYTELLLYSDKAEKELKDNQLSFTADIYFSEPLNSYKYVITIQ